MFDAPTRMSKQSTPPEHTEVPPTTHSSRTSSSRSISHASTTYSTHPSAIHRPLTVFYPTHAVFTPHHPGPRPASPPLHWSSRNSRKNRIAPRQVHVVHHASATPESTETGMGKDLSEAIVVEQRLHHPQTRLKAHLSWDVSFWVAFVFTLGSILWVINGFLLYLPLAPSQSLPHANAAAWTAFAGGTAFEIGSYLTVVEALNAGHEQLFGPALWGLMEGREHPGEETSTATSSWWKRKARRAAGMKLGVRRKIDFRWFGTTSWRELGFLASVTQLFAATVFWVSTITGLPGVIPNLSTAPPIAISDVFYWTPQVVGGTGFIVSSLLMMIECQRKWWSPNLRAVGWHIGFWNLVGAVGFTLCGALGYAALASSKANYQSVLATFWGSWGFLIGSTIQLYETLWRESTDAGDNSPSD